MSFRAIVFITLLWCVQFASAQTFTPFYKNEIEGGGYVAWGDFDKDGDSDLIMSGGLRENQAVTILYRNDNGTFNEVANNFQNYVGYPKWVDWENDNDLDLFLHDRSTNALILFKNVNGVLGSAYAITNIQNPFWIDFDGDSDLDVAGISSAQLVIKENRGASFQNNVPGLPKPISYFNIDDYNNDGASDFLLKESGAIRLYLNINGVYTVDASASFAFPNSATFASFDYDDDGDVDILISGFASDYSPLSYLYKNVGNGFSLVIEEFLSKGSVSARNFNGDQRMDLTVRTNDSTLYYTNQGNGTYLKEAPSSVLYEFQDILSQSFSNTPGETEQYMCISGTSYYQFHPALIYKMEAGTFKKVYKNPLSYYDAGVVQWLDYNQDGLMDVYVSDPVEAPNPKLFKNKGASLELAHEFVKGTAAAGDWTDFNKDGKIDFITSDSRKLFLHEGFLDGSVTSSIIANSTFDKSIPKVIDFDRDNDNDVFVSEYMQGIYVNKNNALSLDIRFDNSYRDLGESDWADFDHDGDLDLVLFLDTTGKEGIRLFRNNGTSFQEVTTGFPSWVGGKVKWIDFDNDSYPDLFMLGWSNSANYIRVYRNNNGTFVAQSAAVFTNLAGIDEYSTHIKIVDFNVDGLLDIVVGSHTVNDNPAKPRMFFYKNKGGSFEVFSNTGVPSWYQNNFDFGDFDGDGDPDLLLQGGGRKTEIYVNSATDTRSPEIAAMVPANHDTIVYSNGYHLKIGFNKRVTKGSGTFSIYRKRDNALVQTINVDSQNVTVDGKDVSLVIEDDLFDNNKEYYILLSPGAFFDVNNNASLGIVDKVMWGVIASNLKKDQQIIFGTFEAAAANASPIELNASATSQLAVHYSSSDTTIAVVSGSLVYIKKPGSATITAFQNGNTEFNSAIPVEQQLIISKLAQEVDFDMIASKRLNDKPFFINAISSSGLPLKFISSDPSIAQIAGDTIVVVGVGEASIIAVQPGNEFYESAQATQTFRVERSLQTISFDPISEKTMLDRQFPIEAIASSNLYVKFRCADLSVASVEGNIVTIVGAGTTTIEAIQDGDESFEPASITRTLTISKVSQEITFQPIGKKNTQDRFFMLQGSASSGLEVVYASSDPSVAIVKNNIVEIIGPGTTWIEASQQGNTIYLAASRIMQPLTVELILAVETNVSSSLSVFPNPARDFVSFSPTAFTGRQPITISLFDNHGQLVRRYETSKEDVVSINVNDLTPGVYILSASQGRNRIVAKFSKQ